MVPHGPAAGGCLSGRAARSDLVSEAGLTTERSHRCTTRSSSAPAAPAHRRRCCSPARATGSCWSTEPVSRATTCPPTGSTSPGWRDSSAGDCGALVATAAHRLPRSPGCRSLRARGHPAAGRRRRRGLLPRGGPSSTRSWSMPRSRPARSCANTSRSKNLVWDGDRVSGIAGRSAGGAMVTEQARIVIGADGLHSLVARQVEAPTYNARPSLSCAYYSYWSGVPLDGRRVLPRDSRGSASSRTHDGARPASSSAGRWTSSTRSAPTSRELPEDAGSGARAGGAVRRGRGRSEPSRGTADHAELLPQAPMDRAGRWWATPATIRTPITAQGISDAFRDAELLTDAIDEGFSGRQPLPDGPRHLRADSATRRHVPIFESHLSVRRAPAAPSRDAATLRGPAPQSGGDRSLLRHHRRHRPYSRVLRAGEPRPDHRRGAGQRGVGLVRPRRTQGRDDHLLG